ncbi:hypothetical protein CathTA2_1642 [Caldalkalibacillus thermarum TA2.A1]|uniref:Uncharacterized protein n=1 Tax=Caldalkalibacillus thermarum (strain TA2.A1) TaxID=986075 RepID=F5L742_CALTT|nr:hypothetical protein CathTA2_1642 [Caldalkalibacillus thermarum TA2.A1]
MNKQMIHTIMKFIRKEISEKQLRQALLKRSHHQ